ncbi:hypothetical protein NEIMUCOT_05581 [Neisseria mucosa ATCC 25996]|uniref:Uncharacterized protein n=1 Tax=Neisseria mucosa (strain ATCC 25996 / DSM 4631 / NCTC 10774 / M26) TaxID=546266 RepID=D2ZY73_NEIM2|nr:hypothetical protein NEIMUCOT_05581 [Neisseria mucosa ATCC 25996]
MENIRKGGSFLPFVQGWISYVVDYLQGIFCKFVWFAPSCIIGFANRRDLR